MVAGTAEAFGVGLIIAGLIDVLAISGLNQLQQRQAVNMRAFGILRSETFSVADAQALLKTDRRLLDRKIAAVLENEIEEIRAFQAAEAARRREEDLPPSMRGQWTPPGPPEDH